MFPYEKHIGEQFHRLTIKSFYKTRINGRITGMYICACQCTPENEVHKNAYQVIKGITKSCGCLKGTHELKYNYNLEIGNSYGILKILDYKRSENGFTLLCQCECGSFPKWLDAYSVFNGYTRSCGCLTKMNERQEMIGKRYGKLTVIGHRTNKRPSGQLYVELLCKCDCGIVKYIDKHDIKRRQLSCGCLVKERLSGRKNKNREKAIYITLYNSKIKAISKKRGMEYDISLEKFINLINQPCYYCGEEGSNIHYDRKKREGDYISDTVLICNGIDRLNPKLGYVSNNLVPCCKYCNTAKMTMTVEEFRLYIIKFHNHFFTKNLGQTLIPKSI